MKYPVWIAAWLVIAGGAGQAQSPAPQNAMDQAFQRIYNFDFPGAYAILNAEQGAHPDNPLIYSTRSAAYLFSEFHRMKILEMDFFADDNKVTDRKRVKPDPQARALLFQETAEAKRRAQARLAATPQDRDAMFALLMSTAVEADYVGIVEKKYFRTYSLSKESQQYARKLLALSPPVYDAYMTLGSVEYVVSSLNFFFRLFIRFDQIEGSKQKAIENLTKVVEGGRFYPPFAKILLSVIHLRDKRLPEALSLLKELERDFPENPLLRSEARRVAEKLQARPAKK